MLKAISKKKKEKNEPIIKLNDENFFSFAE
jgi:hypothetical protein